MTVESPFMPAQKLPSVLRVGKMKKTNDFKGCMVAEEGLEPSIVEYPRGSTGRSLGIRSVFEVDTAWVRFPCASAMISNKINSIVSLNESEIPRTNRERTDDSTRRGVDVLDGRKREKNG